jgi:hypothetical protein
MIYETEKKYIEQYNSYNGGLNATIGGEGCLGYVHSPEVRERISKGTKNGDSHKGKTYEILYGDRAIEEKEKRKSSVKKGWENLTTEKKEERVLKMTTSIQKKSKHGVELVKEIKGKINEGLKVKQLKQLYPQVREGFFYELKNGRCWTNI